MAKEKSLARKGSAMASSSVDKKSATDSLLEGMDELIDSAAEKMTDRQFKRAEKQFNDVVDRAVASRSRKRETA
jgi:hypothetical protein